MFLIDDIVLAPIKGIYSLVKVIHDQMEQEMYDPHKIQEELMQLQMQFEMDEITESEYDEREAELLERLIESKNRIRNENEE